MEPMKGKWASSRIDVGYTELLCIPEVTAVFLSSYDCGMWTLWCSIKHIEASYVFNYEHRLALQPMQGIRTSSPAEEISHVISRVAAGTWGLFSSYSGDDHFKTPLCSVKSGLLSS